MSLHHEAETFLLCLAERNKLNRIVDAMPPGTECIFIIRRPADHAVAFEVFGPASETTVETMFKEALTQFHGESVKAEPLVA